MMIAIQKIPEWPGSWIGRRKAILAATISAANKVNTINWKVEKYVFSWFDDLDLINILDPFIANIQFFKFGYQL